MNICFRNFFILLGWFSIFVSPSITMDSEEADIKCYSSVKSLDILKTIGEIIDATPGDITVVSDQLTDVKFVQKLIHYP